MPNNKHGGDLEINQDLDFQHGNWIVERVSWVVMALVALAALLGLFGRGPLSRAQTGNKTDAVWMEYSRFERYLAPVRLRIHLGPSAGHKGKVHLSLNRDYLEKVQIQHVTPEPQSVEAGSKQLTYVFQVTDPSQPTEVTFDLQTEHIGSLSGEVALPGKQPLSFSQFIYP